MLALPGVPRRAQQLTNERGLKLEGDVYGTREVKPEAKREGGDLFIVDNGDTDWKVLRYLHDWADLAHTLDIATGYFEISSLLALDGQWQKLAKLRILMGDEVSKRTRK